MKKIFTLLLGSLIMISVDAQVGVNNSNPEQALDVAGKIKLTDDATSPTAGTMRYNNTNSAFEGHNGTQWHAFNNGSGIPTNAKMVFSNTKGMLPAVSASPTSLVFKDEKGITVVNTTVPSGKYLLITYISLSPTSFLNFDTETPFYGIRINYSSNSQEISGKYIGGNLFSATAGYAPLGIIRANASFSIGVSLLANTLKQFSNGIDAYVVGFLVDDLKFD